MSRKVIAGVIIAVFIIGLLIISQISFLTVRTDDETVYYTPILRENREVIYQYTHSVEQGPVREYFRISRDGFTLYRTSFTSQGAGLPLDRGVFEKEDDVFVRSGLDDRYSSLSFRLSHRFEEQFIELGDKEFKMSDWGDPGDVLRFEINSLTDLLGL